MNAHSLSLEFAPLLIWQKGDPRTNSRNSYSKKTEGDSKSMEFAASRTAVDNLSGNILFFKVSLLTIKMYLMNNFSLHLLHGLHIIHLWYKMNNLKGFILFQFSIT